MKKNISHLPPIFYEGILSFPIHVSMLQAHVHCTTFLFIHFLFLTLQIGLLSAEVREYTQLVNREEETISHIVLSKDKQ